MSLFARRVLCHCILALVGSVVLLGSGADRAAADIRLPALFTDHMVLQRDHANPIWGWAEPGEKVTVVVAEKQSKRAVADANGKWRVTLDPMPVGGPHKIVIEGKNRIAVEDVLIGEVWVCSGQSNMAWRVNSTTSADLTRLTANFPKIRMVTVPTKGTQQPQDDFQGSWQVCSPETVDGFSAVGYFFAHTLHQALDIPIGMIHDSWGGSACEAWVPRNLLEADSQYKPLIERWQGIEKAGTNTRALSGNARPGNLYNGMLTPVIGYGIRGAIWYQGESNAGRAYQYRHLFPLMIKSWRDAWKQGDFPFYWVQLADFRPEPAEPGESSWAELREAQTMTLQLPNTGQAVIIDIGEADDIHPRNKEDVGERLARWALARDYGVEIAYRSAEYASMDKKGGRITISFDHVNGGLKPYDVNKQVEKGVKEVTGFTIAGADKKFVTAKAKVVGPKKNMVELWCDEVSDPVAVRYAWAENPVCNLRDFVGLPVTPFRTDDWPGITVDAK